MFIRENSENKITYKLKNTFSTMQKEMILNDYPGSQDKSEGDGVGVII